MSKQFTIHIRIEHEHSELNNIEIYIYLCSNMVCVCEHERGLEPHNILIQTVAKEKKVCARNYLQ